jgi:hypothetical protein
MASYMITETLTLGATTKRDMVNARTTWVMWHEEHFCNVGVLQRVRLPGFLVY